MKKCEIAYAVFMHELYDGVHMIGVALFFGGIIASVVLLFLAERRGRADALQIEAKRTLWTSSFITIPGVVLITLSGIFQMSYTKDIASESWLVVGLVLFALAVGVLFAFFIPAQKKLFRDAESAGEVITSDLFTTLYRIYILGAIMLLLPLGTMAFSIIQPELW